MPGKAASHSEVWLYFEETLCQSPVVPPSTTSRVDSTSPLRHPQRDSSSSPPRKQACKKHIVSDATVHESKDSKSITLEKHKTLKKRLRATCRSTWRAIWRSLCPPPSSELNDTESSTDCVLDYYRQNELRYGYGLMSAGQLTRVPHSALARARGRRLSSDGLVAQPSPQGNTIR